MSNSLQENPIEIVPNNISAPLAGVEERLGILESGNLALRKHLESEIAQRSILQQRVEALQTQLQLERGRKPSLLLHLNPSNDVNPFEYFSKSNTTSQILRKGDALLATNDVSGAILSYIEALELEPENKHIHFRLGKAHMICSQISKAIESFQAALKYDHQKQNQTEQMSSSPALYLHLGACYLMTDDFEAAIRAYGEALILNPFCIYSRIGIGRSFKARGDLELSLNHFKLAMWIAPEDVTALECLAYAQFEKKNIEEAEYLLNRLVACAPNNEQARGLLQWINDNHRGLKRKMSFTRIYSNDSVKNEEAIEECNAEEELERARKMRVDSQTPSPGRWNRPVRDADLHSRSSGAEDPHRAGVNRPSSSEAALRSLMQTYAEAAEIINNPS